jgi:hypothetical protein
MNVRTWVLWSLLAFMACGTNRSEELRLRLAAARTLVQRFEAIVTPENMLGNQTLQAVKADLERAELSLIEDQFEEAEQLILSIDARVGPFLEGRNPNDQGSELAFAEFIGDVRLAVENGPAERITADSHLVGASELKTGIRSGTVLQLFAGATLQLADQTELRIEKLDPVTRELHLNLLKGQISGRHNSNLAPLKLAAMGQSFAFQSEAQFESNLDPQSGIHYLAVFAGEVNWQGPSVSGIIVAKEALVWGEGKQDLVELPPHPEAEAPPNHRVIQVPPGEKISTVRFRWSSHTAAAYYQLQVATEPQFLTRVFDSRTIATGTQTVDLDLGQYYWRVRSLNKDQLPSAYSAVAGFTLVEGTLQAAESKPGPPLKIHKIEVIDNLAIVSGSSVSRALVSANGVRAVMNDDGSFRVIVNFPRAGQQELEVIARFEEGGETVTKHLVKVRF